MWHLANSRILVFLTDLKQKEVGLIWLQTAIKIKKSRCMFLFIRCLSISGYTITRFLSPVRMFDPDHSLHLADPIQPPPCAQQVVPGRPLMESHRRLPSWVTAPPHLAPLNMAEPQASSELLLDLSNVSRCSAEQTERRIMKYKWEHVKVSNSVQIPKTNSFIQKSNYGNNN